MKLHVLVVAVILAIGLLLSATSLGDGGFIMNFLVAFGLITIIGVLVLVSKAKKQDKK